MRLAVLMTCYNRVETTLACLRRLLAQKLPAETRVDIWLVDDASPDRTGERVAEWFARQASAGFELHVVAGTGSLYWSRGMRLAWDRAAAGGTDYDFHLWLNDDVALAEDALAGLLADAASLPGNVLLVGSLLQEEGGEAVSFGCGSGDDGSPLVRPTGRPVESVGEEVNGNVVLVPRAVTETVGGISGVYRHYYGDFDYARRARKRGCRVYVASSFVGVCRRTFSKPLGEMTLVERLRSLADPRGYCLRDAVLYRMRNDGLLRAVFSAGHILFRAFLPGTDA